MGRHASIPRIGFYTASRGQGGAEKYLADLLNAGDHPPYQGWLFCRRGYPLAGDGVNVVYLDGPPAGGAVSSRPAGPRREHGRAWRRAAPRSLRLLAGALGEARRMAAFFRAHPVDLLHFNDTGCEPAVLAARLAGVPAITGTLHVLPSYEPGQSDLAHRCIEQVSMRCLDAAVAVSEFTRQAWLRRTHVDPGRVRVIYNGFDMDAFQPARPQQAVRAKIGVPAGCPVVGMTARLHGMKGHVYLLRALPRVLEAVPDAHVVLAGDGGLRQALEQQARGAGIADRVHFLGHRTDVADVTQVYDLAVLPSVSLETLGYALMEAMVLRKPVVASRFSGIPEVVAEGVTGTLVPPRDPPALAAAIVDLLSDRRKARRFGEAGYRRVKEHFTMRRMLEETFALYQELLRRRRRGGRARR
jgi:glycosyltransferase involved in cell wall biosynthesis